MTHRYAPFEHLDVPGLGASGEPVNVAGAERIGSALLGSALLAASLRRRGGLGVLLGLAGGLLLRRGATGKCELYHQLGVSTAGRR